MRPTIRGVIAGSLALIVLYVLGQSGTGSKVSGATSLISQGLSRFMSPSVAGVPQRKTAGGASTAAPPAPAPATGGSMYPPGTV